MKTKLWLTLLLGIGLAASAAAQFSGHGTATQAGTTYTLTELRGDCTTKVQIAAIWYQKPIALNKPFTICFDAFFGDKKEGADGLCFVLKSDTTKLGTAGYGGALGYYN
jgi:hypothetical protein